MGIVDRPLSLEGFRYKGGLSHPTAIAFPVKDEQRDRGKAVAL